MPHSSLTAGLNWYENTGDIVAELGCHYNLFWRASVHRSRRFLSLLLRSLMFSVPSTNGAWEEAAGEKLPAACSPDENEGKLWWIFMTVLTVPS